MSQRSDTLDAPAGAGPAASRQCLAVVPWAAGGVL
jgi:hypothetical protein